MFNKILIIVICHLIGDYVLQCDFIAKTKGTNYYHMLVHCLLYLVPFTIAFGIDWRIYLLLISHLIIDPLKARYNKINQTVDQILHYMVASIFLF